VSETSPTGKWLRFWPWLGAVATGVGGDRSGNIAAAAHALPEVEALGSWARVDGFMVRPAPAALTLSGARLAGKNRVRDGSAPTAVGTKRAGRLAAIVGKPRKAPSHAGSAAPEQSSLGAVVPLPRLPDQVAGVVSTVKEAALVIPAVPPLQAPSLPPVPVDVPKVPGGTPLP